MSCEINYYVTREPREYARGECQSRLDNPQGSSLSNSQAAHSRGCLQPIYNYPDLVFPCPVGARTIIHFNYWVVPLSHVEQSRDCL